MAYEVKLICDSVNPYTNVRLSTFACTYPEIIHNEVMTHAALVKNASSSRAIPYPVLRKQIMDDPFIPLKFGKNQKGMQAASVLDEEASEKALGIWLKDRDFAVKCADELWEQGVHKELVNRLVQPWKWITTLISATDFQNFFYVRDNTLAEEQGRIGMATREISKVAELMRGLLAKHQPTTTLEHLPFVPEEDSISMTQNGANIQTKQMVSSARCARVSYLNHEGKKDIVKDLKLAETLINDNHWSPLEHPAVADEQLNSKRYQWTYKGKYRGGWIAFRKTFPNEYVRG